MAQHALGQRLGMDRTTTMQSVQALEEAGAVRREDDPADRRVYRVSLTADGRRLVATLEGRIKRVETDMLAPLSAPERETFAAQLRAILAHGGGCA
jgi:DNA-binding MarR family transcriptional regulator